jgi:hypothetical protein
MLVAWPYDKDEERRREGSKKSEGVERRRSRFFEEVGWGDGRPRFRWYIGEGEVESSYIQLQETKNKQTISVFLNDNI